MPPQRIQQQIIHIKTSHLPDKLYDLHTQTELEAEKQNTYKRTCFRPDDRKDHSKRNEPDHISRQIAEYCKGAERFSVYPESLYLPKWPEIVGVGPSFYRPAISFCKKQKIRQSQHIRKKQHGAQYPYFLFCLLLHKIRSIPDFCISEVLHRLRSS